MGEEDGGRGAQRLAEGKRRGGRGHICLSGQVGAAAGCGDAVGAPVSTLLLRVGQPGIGGPWVMSGRRSS